jgi:SAM-dependent methyltransferase
MGAETCGAAQAALGEPVTAATEISAREAFRLWAADYDTAPNALLALETRLLAARLSPCAGMRILDAGCGTGRWMCWAAERGGSVFGIDPCREMLMQADARPDLQGKSALADITAIPLHDNAVDLALCAFTMAYVVSPARAFRELARVSRQVIVSDLHPEAARAGWSRSFRNGDRSFNVAHTDHSADDLDNFARKAGLERVWRLEAPFGEPERGIFARAGKQDAFAKTRGVPAVLITLWRKSSV